MRYLLDFLDKAFPHHRSYVVIKPKSSNWRYDPIEERMRGATSLADIERRMRDLAYCLPLQ